MPTRIFAASGNSGKVYLVGRVGLDNPGFDVGAFAYTGTFRTERHSAAGEGGLLLFRRVRLRVWHTGGFDATVKIFVDGAQTQVWSTDVEVDQSILFSVAPPVTVGPDGGFETILVADLEARGTYLDIEFALDITTLTGIALPESAEAGYREIRRGVQQAAETA